MSGMHSLKNWEKTGKEIQDVIGASSIDIFWDSLYGGGGGGERGTISNS